MAIIRDTKTGRLHGVRAEARRLKVTPGHLTRVVKGERESKGLLNRVRVIEEDLSR